MRKRRPRRVRGNRRASHKEAFMFNCNRKCYGCVSLLALFLSIQLASQVGFNGPGHYQITNVRTGGILVMDGNVLTSILHVPVAITSPPSHNQVLDNAPAPCYSY